MPGEYNKEKMKASSPSIWGILGSATKDDEKWSVLSTDHWPLTTDHWPLFYAATDRARLALRTAAVKMLSVSLVGQMSEAPALNAAVHISSSARR